MSWAAFFFSCESVRPLQRFRVLLAVWTALSIAGRLAYADELWALPVLRAGLVATAPPLWSVYAAVGVLMVGVAGVVAGRATRVATVMVFAAFVWLMAVEVRMPRAYVVLAAIQWGLLVLAPTARVGVAPRWATRLLMLEFSAVYAFAAIGKLVTPGWRSGEAMALALRGPHLGDHLLSSVWALDAGPWPWLIAWGTIAGELFIAIGLWFARTRGPAIATLVALHLGIAATLRISVLFHALMFAHVVLFVGRREDRRLRV